MATFSVDQVLDRFEQHSLPEAIGWYPAVDVTESPEEYTFIAELPGLKKEEVTISWDHDVLTIKGEKTREVKKADEEKKFHLYERSYGSFLRTFTLPEKVVAEKIAAEMEHGVLKVHVPKAPEVKAAAKKIDHAVLLGWQKRMPHRDVVTIDGREAHVSPVPFYDKEGARARM